MKKVICKICKKQFYVSPCRTAKFCSQKCCGEYKRKTFIKANHHNWKGGIIIATTGYVLVHKPNHPFCDTHGYVRRSRLVMEKYLDRYLKPEEVIHHINKIKDDDRIENLKLFANQSKHISFHHKSRK